MEIGKLTVSGIEVLTILNMTITAALGQHAQMELECIMKADKVQEYMDKVTKQDKINVSESNKVLFSGHMISADCNVNQKYAQMKILVKSGSYLLDKEKHTKSYQDINQTYWDVMESKASCRLYGEERNVESILLQYRETDWAFIKRIASKCQMPIYPDMISDNTVIYCGIDSNASAKEIHVLDAELMKHSDIITYRLSSDDFFKVGEVINYQGKKLYISEVECKMEQAGFHAVYCAKTMNDMKCREEYLYDMAGAALEGRIIDVAGDKVKVHLQVDATQDTQKAYWFPFSTMQSSSDGSGWYYMPEIGDCVKVCIPGWEEQGAFAVSAVSTYQAESGSEDRMADTNVKYMRNPSGKEIQLSPDSINADGGGNASLMSMKTDGSIILASKTSLQIEASETIEIIAEAGIEMEASEVIDIKADTSGELLLDENGDIRQLGGQVNINSEE